LYFLKKFKFRTPSTYKYCLRLIFFKKIKTSRLFYVSYFIFLYNCFFNFIVQKINFKMVKCGMMMVTGREKIDMVNADVVVSWIL
jgi:hypothetical protein